MEPLHRLKLTEPPQWLVPSPPLSEAAREASKHLFSSLRPHVRKYPFDKLLVDGFDAEQIWQQLDLFTQPLVRSGRRRVKHWEKNPEEIETLLPEVAGGEKMEEKKTEQLAEDDDEDGDMDVDDEDEDEDGDMDVDDDEEDEDEEGSEEEEEKIGGIEDTSFKINELKEYLEEEEAKHYGLDPKKKKSKGSQGKKLKGEDDDSEDDEEEDEDDELDFFGEGDDDVEEDDMANARAEDFFAPQKGVLKKSKFRMEDTSSEEEEEEQQQQGSSCDDEEDNEKPDEKPKVLSTHEKELQKKQAEIEKMEKANLDPKPWTLQGEVKATDRPKNSALEVDLDFEHNVGPVPVITEEVTQSLEEMIKKRILEGQFNDRKKAPGLPSKAPREFKQMDENKSSKGLAEVYENEYVQQTNPAAAPLSFSDEQKTEASTLFKKLRLKLDALSHFHFAPKPVIEDMTIQSNVPALAMEEIAPLAVSDAAMLAPEEVFEGKGNVKAEVELTQEERKRRRATKKRKHKAKMARKAESIKAREDELQNQKAETEIAEEN